MRALEPRLLRTYSCKPNGPPLPASPTILFGPIDTRRISKTGEGYHAVATHWGSRTCRGLWSTHSLTSRPDIVFGQPGSYLLRPMHVKETEPGNPKNIVGIW